MTRWRRSLLVVLVIAPACEPRLDLGSSVLWAAGHETGDVGEWAAAGASGGALADAASVAVAATTEQARSGAYSVKLTNGAAGAYQHACLWRQGEFPQEAYYSAWLLLPAAYRTTGTWSIMELRSPHPVDATVLSHVFQVDIRPLPGGELILSVYDHRAAYLRAPTPSPALLVPIGRWFHVEIFCRNTSDDTGRITVWLDGQPNYDLVRPTGLTRTVYWSVCNGAQDLVPAPAAIYVDDAAVSVVRVTPEGAP